MKQILLILFAFVAFAAYSQPGPPWVTGSNSGDGELKLQFGYLNARTDSGKNVFDYEIGYSNPDSINAALIKSDSAVIVVLDYEPPHGAYAFADSTAILDLTQNTWAKITNVANDLYTAVDADGLTLVGDSITIITPGDYMMWVNMSFNGNAQDVYHCAVYKNGVVTPMEMHRKTANNDTGNMGMSGLVDNLVAGDDFSLYIQNTANNNDPTFISSQITILMIHPR